MAPRRVSTAASISGNIASRGSKDTARETNGAVQHNGSSLEENGISSPSTCSGSGESFPQPTNGIQSGIDRVGRGMKALVNAINKLERVGIESFDLPVPKIVVVGDQSAGKSSLIEAISEIKVPRSSGTCTRCPMQITLKGTEIDTDWNCNVSLLKKYDFHGNYPGGMSFSKEEKFGPWMPRDVPDEHFFKHVRHKEDLEEVIKCAQRAVLNPQDDPKLYLEEDPNDLSAQRTQVAFSPNVIRLEITGKDLPTLSFYDLPGIINQTEDSSEPYLVKLVKNLVKDYIRSPEAIVLLACSMENDIANSSASKVVKSVGAQGRCLGVLTKPDRVPDGVTVKTWSDILEGVSFVLGYGYYVTKQPSSIDLNNGITHAQARVNEHEFFTTKEPWCKSLSKFSNRYGTEALQANLSDLLEAKIREYLPRIAQQIQEKISHVEQELKELPEPPNDDSLWLIVNFLTKFDNNLRMTTKGDRPHHQFMREWNEAADQFRTDMMAMQPRFSLRSDGETERQKNAEAATKAIVDLESGDEAPGPPTPSKKRGAPGPFNTPSKRAKATSATPVRRNGNEHAKTFTLDSIRQEMRKANASNIPDSVSPKAVKLLIKSCIEDWSTPVMEFLRARLQAMRGMVDDNLSITLGKWAGTKLNRDSTQLVREFLDDRQSKLEIQVDKILCLERIVMTRNDEYWKFHKNESLKLIQTTRRDVRAKIQVLEDEIKSGKFTNEEVRKKKALDMKPELLGPDPFQTEIDVMANMRGYYHVAAMRLIDHICQLIMLDMFKHCKKHLKDELAHGLGIQDKDALDKCKLLLAPDAEREAHRQRLKKDKERLQEAQEYIASV